MCEKVSDGLQQSSKERERRVIVHRCESIVQVIRQKPDTSVDFIIFAFDGRVSQPLSDVSLIYVSQNPMKYVKEKCFHPNL